MTTRKRRRQEAFAEQPEPEVPPQTEEEKAQARLEKEQEIWDAIREAHYEAIEQLPLTLQRQLSLMRQLDEQTSTCATRLLPALHEYLEVRRQMAGTRPIYKDQNDELTDPTIATSNGDASPRATPSSTKSTLPTDKSTPETTREMIRQLAVISEEFLRASQEKVNLAQANYDSVERHIQLLEQAIKEQEDSLSADPSNPVHIHLPELVIPQFRNKPGRKSAEDEMTQALDAMGEFATNEKLSKKKGGSGKKGNQEQESPSFTITLPASQSYEELLYCYCNRVSFGEMIACDGQSCQREWFHLGCVGLLEPPEGEWYCEDCNSDDT